MNSTMVWWEPEHVTPPLHEHPQFHHLPTPRRWPPGLTIAVGAFYACMGGVHIGMVAADPQIYAGFADGSPWEWVRVAWADIFMAHPAGWGLFAALLEITLAALLLTGGRASKLGWVGVVAFQFALVLFGWGYLWWSVPAVAALVLSARADWSRLEPEPWAT